MTKEELHDLFKSRRFSVKESTLIYSFTEYTISLNDRLMGKYEILSDENGLQLKSELHETMPIHIIEKVPYVIGFFDQHTNRYFVVLEEIPSP